MRAKDLISNVSVPQDTASIEKLVHGGLLLSSLALSEIVSRKFRFLAYGVAGLMAVSAFTGFSAVSLLLESSVGRDEETDDEELEPRKVGVPAIAALGVPHRIPEEAVGLRHDPHERPAPSPEGDIGLSD